MADTPQVDHTLVEITGEIVAAYVAHNAIATSDLAKLIADVYSAVSGTVKRWLGLSEQLLGLR
jgi:predicted transcriptional regulator